MLKALVIKRFASNASAVGQSSKLKFAYKNSIDAFGVLVKDAEKSLSENKDQNDTIRVVTLDDLERRDQKGKNRLDPATFDGKSSGGKLLLIPRSLSEAVNDGLKKGGHDPQKIRKNTASYYVSLQDGKPHVPALQPIDVDTHIAGLFLQNYSSCSNVLEELKRRTKKDSWSPKNVLDIGFGPATGMVAFNEVFNMSSDQLSKKTAVVLGHSYMLKRAKSILATQACEEFDPNNNKIKTKIQGYMPSLERNKDEKYDLIIATHQLFAGKHNFPENGDRLVRSLIDLLSENGVIVFVERGDPNGFESIARARQVILRPEDFEYSGKKLPVLYKGRSSSNSQPGDILENEDSQFSSENSIVDTHQAESRHFEVLAPCTHHGKCPLQLNPTQRSNDKSGKFNWCRFAQMVQRPRFSLELKKGVYLSAPWSSADAGRASTGKGLSGNGRPFGRSHETSVFSYLIIRSSTGNMENQNPKSVDTSEGRIMRQPMKRDGHVIMEVCGSNSGLIEQWIVPKSFSKQAYYDARKSSGGDIWTLGYKTKTTRQSNKQLLESFLNTKNKKKASLPPDDVSKFETDFTNSTENKNNSIDMKQASMLFNGQGARAGRKKTKVILRGHDPNPKDDESSIDDYFMEIGEVEKNTSKYRRQERKFQQHSK